MLLKSRSVVSSRQPTYRQTLLRVMISAAASVLMVSGGQVFAAAPSGYGLPSSASPGRVCTPDVQSTQKHVGGYEIFLYNKQSSGSWLGPVCIVVPDSKRPCTPDLSDIQSVEAGEESGTLRFHLGETGRSTLIDVDTCTAKP
ncbi:hypothetical protein ACKC9G_11650 [Pokkaliibacter sp. CJK22405]|uniref:hypothetical protein n=1 Tax=Pokkaliibacter sp. CJK22405 TaxID=3384615 RepID=UPI003984CF07